MLSRRLLGVAHRQARRSLPRTHTTQTTRFQPSRIQRRLNSTYDATAAQAQAQATVDKKPGLIRRFLSYTAVAILAYITGTAMGSAPAIQALAEAQLRPTTDADTLGPGLFAPATPEEQAVEAYIDAHPLAASLRADPAMTESRPHLKMPAALRRYNLTGSTLLGPGRCTVPPRAWTEGGGRSIVTISHVGADLCGHPGIVHGGYLATMLDEGLARCCFGALPHNVGMTASLTVNYKAPARAGTYIVLRATTTKVEGRKAWVEGRLETLPDREGEEPVVLATAEGLFISPRNAELMQKVYPVN